MHFDYDKPDSQEEAVMISEFQEYMTDKLDMVFVVEPRQRVMIGFDLNEGVKELEKKCFLIFANQGTCKLAGGVVNALDNFPILYIKLLRKTNDEIICKKVTDTK